MMRDCKRINVRGILTEIVETITIRGTDFLIRHLIKYIRAEQGENRC